MKGRNRLESTNIEKFLITVSEIVDQKIGLDHIHPSSKSRFFYTQAPKKGSPLLLNHYRGPFFIDIHPDDYEAIFYGKIDAIDYIKTANWQIGYFWGGGSMVGGGYYQPFDIVGHQDEVRRYFKILSCRGNRLSSGYMPSEEVCANCPVDNCPFSKYKEGNWNSELQEADPRIDLFKAIKKRFTREYPDYTLKGLTCGEIPEEQVWLIANGRFSEEDPYSFAACVSENVIQSLLMHDIQPESWDNFANDFQFRIHKPYNDETFDVNPESLKKAFEGLNYYSKKITTQPEVVSKVSSEGKVSLISRFFKRK